MNIYKYKGFEFRADREMGNRMLNNNYEKEEIKIITSVIDKNELKNLKVLELGGCLGVVSTITNYFLSNKKNHVIIEANPELIKYLEFNKDRNNCLFHIENYFISNKPGSTYFKAYDKLVAGSAHRKDNLEKNQRTYLIKNVTLDSLVKKYDIFDFIIMDIEGGELEFLYQNIEYIKNNVKYLMVEIHEFLMYKHFQIQCINVIIKECNMRLIYQDGISFLFKK